MVRRVIAEPSFNRSLAIAFLFMGTMNWRVALGECKLLLLAQLPIIVQSNRPLIDGEINGQKIKILIDTGAQYAMLWRSEAVRLGLQLQDVHELRIFGVGGETRVQAARMGEFKLAEFVARNVRFLVGGEGENDSFSMILGEDFLSKLTVEFDLAHGAIRLFRPQGCKPEQLMYWSSSTYSAAALESTPADALAIITAVELNDKRVVATLDTGASRSVVSTGAAASAVIRPSEPPVESKNPLRTRGIGSHPVELTAATFDSIAIGDESIKNIRLQVGDIGRYMKVTPTGSRLEESLKRVPTMLIGADFFVSHRIIVPSEMPILLFTYAGGPVFQVMHDVAAADGADPAP